MHCTARSSRTGSPCQAHAIRGGTVCVAHGGRAPQVRAAALRRLELAEALERDPRRHPGTILLDTLHTVDHLMRAEIGTAGAHPIDPDRLERIIALLERAQRYARDVLALDLAERQSITAAEVELHIARITAELGTRALTSGDDDA